MKRLISILVSLGILAIIYMRIDRERLLEIFAQCDPSWMAISLGMVIPITLITSFRLDVLMPRAHKLGVLESNRLILAAAVLNMVLPSKMGDIAKAYFMREKGHLSGSLALSLVVFEKGSDMLSLLLWCVFGLLLFPQNNALFWGLAAVVAVGLVTGSLILGSLPFARFFFGMAQRFAPGKIGAKFGTLSESWEEMHGYFWQRRSRLFAVAGISVFLWFLHLLQIWMFMLALRVDSVELLTNLALTPLAILAGLMPLTFAGVGTRDAALIALYQPYFGEPTGAALGLLCTARYIMPAILGLPFLHHYWGRIAEARKLKASS
ncbi:lysylphosphatidylglycerol synthetase [Acidobacteria bacterium Mor1]|nr:lysylphosphatidylglycerol synthetase [Acidobacteria bacterium Mor1]